MRSSFCEVLGLVGVFASVVQGGKVLVAPCAGLFSHEEAAIRIGKELKRGGHTVGLAKTQWFLHDSSTTAFFDEEYTFHFSLKDSPQVTHTSTGIYSVLMSILGMVGISGEVYTDPALQNITTAGYDIVLTDAECLYWGGIPNMVGYKKWIQYHTGAWPEPLCSLYHKLFAPMAHTPMDGPFTTEMSFLQRLENALVSVIGRGMYVLLEHQLLGVHERATGVVPIHKSFILASTPVGFDIPRHMPPNVRVIGPLMTRPAEPVEGPLREWMDGASDGFALVSLGSQVHLLPEEVMASVLALLPLVPRLRGMRLLLALPSLADAVAAGDAALPAGVRVERWLPQNDVLAHGNCKLLVSHGGLNSVMESLYHNKPVVAIAYGDDRVVVGARLEWSGAGIPLGERRGELTGEILLDSVLRVATEPSFAVEAARVGALVREESGPAGVRRWAEYVMRHGYQHLVVHADYDMPWWSYHSLDIAAFTLLATAAMVAACRWARERGGCCAGARPSAAASADGGGVGGKRNAKSSSGAASLVMAGLAATVAAVSQSSSW